VSRRNKPRENYVYQGLIFKNQPIPGSNLYTPAPDTVEREKVITPYLARGHSYRETAHELLLLGFEPPRHSDIRAFLLKYCDGMIAALHPYQRGHVGEAVNPQVYRKQIMRHMGPLGDAFEPPPQNWQVDEKLSARDFPVIASLAASGLMPNSYHGFSMPDGALYDLRRLRSLVEKTTDARLLQAYHEAHELLMTNEGEMDSWVSHHFPGDAALDLTRSMLPGHHCTTRHTPAQLLLPRTIICMVDPASTSPEPLPPDFRMMLRSVGKGLEALIHE
jgi:hypothetical protein